MIEVVDGGNISNELNRLGGTVELLLGCGISYLPRWRMAEIGYKSVCRRFGGV
jgi:hypothetical protein